ncbi:MAG: hypothetical protein AB7H97_08530 [Pseudobdellovibrionaceae bacterium]
MKTYIAKMALVLTCLLALACSNRGFKDAAGSPPLPVDQELGTSDPTPDDSSQNQDTVQRPGDSSQNQETVQAPGDSSQNQDIVQTPGGSQNQDVIQTPDSENQVSQEPQCQISDVGTELVKPTKVLFIVDQSGSNLGDPPPGNDPYKTFRMNVIQDFYNRHHQKTLLSWGFISFKESLAKALINSGVQSSAIFSNDSASMAQAIDVFSNISDGGNTPYKEAMKMARELISSDLATSPIETEYLVALITDGEPSDYCSNGLLNCPGVEDAIDKDLKDVVDLSPSRIKIGTVYYGKENLTATARLQRLAKLGGGQFVDANKTSEIKLDNVIRFPGSCP